MTIFSRIREFFNRPVLDPPRYITVTVRKGDSLSSLAQRHLGAASIWPEIYALNKGTIGPDPHKIKPGMVLTLPRKGEP